MTTAPAKSRSAWRETRKGSPCGGCGKSDGYCTISPQGDLCLCRHGAVSPHPKRQKDGTIAYFHPTGGNGSGGTVSPKRQAGPTAVKPKLPEAELKRIVRSHQSALSDRKLAIAAASLALSPESLRAYGVGYDERTDALSFPMFDGDGRLIGVRLRLFKPGEDGKRGLCVRGSSNGLFVPAGFDVAAAPDPLPGVDAFAPMLLAMPEGPTSSAAAWRCGFQAVGRPNNNACGDMIRRLLQRCRQAGAPRDVVVVGDADQTHWLADHTPYWPGWEGALAVAGSAIGPAASIRVVLPSAAKDLREALKAAAPQDVGAALVCQIERAAVVTQAWLSTQRRTLDRVKACCHEQMRGERFASDAERDDRRRRVETFARYLVSRGDDGKWMAARQARKAG